MRRRTRRLQQLDLHIFQKVTGSHSPLLDSLLLPLTRMADRSLLWILIGMGLATGGGRFGKRAALRGFVSISATSLIANQPLKRIARRRRPELLPKARRLVRRPVSYSFPSGHAASAAAFSTAVALEIPQLSVPVGALALGVAASRVYSGVHYPSDVIAGAGIGLTVGLATRRFWPLASRRQADAQKISDPVLAPSSADGEGVTIVVNASAGSALSGSPAGELRGLLPKARVVEMSEGDDLAKALQEASEGCLAIGIAGGDGSANAAAAVALEKGKPLLLVPGGTLNHLARDLGISSVKAAVEALQIGSAAAVDVGLIAGEPFLNTASFGIYTTLVDIREKLEPKIGKWPALCVALFRVLGDSDPVEVELDGRKRKLWMIFVGNCRYRPSGFAPTWRDRLDDGRLDVRLVDGSPPWGRTRLLVAVITGTLAKTAIYEETVRTRLRVKCLDGDLRLARDGEIFEGTAQFSIEKSPDRLLIYRRSGS